jgi:hypothetical protein
VKIGMEKLLGKLPTMTAAVPLTKLGTSTATAEPPAAQTAIARDQPGDERRRGQRVLLRVRAQIHVMQQGKRTTFDVATLSVNPHGALVVMDQGLAAESLLVLEHTGTRQRIACKVVRPAKKMPEGYHVPIEFDSPAPDFWKIDFPPADWRADE